MAAATQTRKIYVAVSNDLQDGIKTLNWALHKWKSYPISIVLLYVTHGSSMDHVITPFGKLPARSVNDEVLKALRKQEQDKIDKLLSKYMAFCGEVPAEVLELEKYDEPIQKRIVDMIIGLQITKLVIGFSVMKPSLKSRGAISGLFYVHQHKPEFCELFILCGGKQVFMRESQNDEKIMDDDNGVVVARMRDKITFKDWLDKVLPERNNMDSPDSSRSPRGSASSSSSSSSRSLESPGSQNQWELYLQEIETYFQDLLSSNDKNIDEQISGIDEPCDDIREQNNSYPRGPKGIEMLKGKLEEARKMIQLSRKEAKEQSDRRAKAEWAICLCNTRAQELEGKIKDEMNMKEELAKELEAEKETTYETRRDIEESRKRLSSLLELQLELSNKLQTSTQAKSQAEIQLETAANTRSEMMADIDRLRGQRDVLYRRIEFCREKDAIGMAARLTEPSLSFREYTTDEIRLATDDFSDLLMLKSGGADRSNVYRGKINHSTVAIKMLTSNHPPQEFQTKVRLLGGVRHPHVVATVGFCTELKCIVLEYMNKGSLRDMLFSRRRNRALRWQDRIRIATEVCSALGFLHAARPRPFIHGHLTPSSILLDRNLVAKIKGLGPNEGSPQSDVTAFGVLIMHLLTGRNWAGLVEDEMMNGESLVKVLDERAGPWPLKVAQKLADLAVKCMGFANGPNPNEGLSIGDVMLELNEIRREGDGKDAGGSSRFSGSIDKEELMDVPHAFLCPILQEVMKNPQVAGDGFSYELEAIEEWVGSGHDRSPMTNARLPHLFFTPNHSLRSLIREWQAITSSHLPH